MANPPASTSQLLMAQLTKPLLHERFAARTRFHAVLLDVAVRAENLKTLRISLLSQPAVQPATDPLTVLMTTTVDMVDLQHIRIGFAAANTTVTAVRMKDLVACAVIPLIPR